MTSVIAPVSVRVENVLNDKKVNSPKNDYVYRSGWNPNAILGQQYRLGVAEARKLVTALTVAFPHLEDRRAAFQELHRRQEVAASMSMTQGSVKLTPAAAKLLTQKALLLGLDLTFNWKQTNPLHPVG
jgi:hypothetical protein